MVITLKNKTIHGEPLEVTYVPEKGMNMRSYKKGNLEIIDQSTQTLFEERYAGLGALIGPHFHWRRPEIISKIKDESLFPHLARVKAKGIPDPFSHGIARYAPWNVESSEHWIRGILTGKDTWNDVPLADLEGQNFKITFEAELLPDGLHIKISVVSDKDSLVGLHYYYHLPEGKGTIISEIQKTMIDHEKGKKVPSQWINEQHLLEYSLDQETDLTFWPFPDPLKGKIILDAKAYRLQVQYNSPSQENCWQLYYPKQSSFVCIEPISAQDPRHPNLTVSSLNVHLQILD
jgi:hypothetical protein